MICQLPTKPLFFKGLNHSYMSIVFPQNGASTFQTAELNTTLKASLPLMLAAINVAGWGYIPSRAVTVLNIGPYMPTCVETNPLLDDLSIQTFRCKRFFCCHSLVRYSFSVNSTTGWFLPSVPSNPEAKSLEATGSGTKKWMKFLILIHHDFYYALPHLSAMQPFLASIPAASLGSCLS